MIFIDSSAYLSALLPQDINRNKALPIYTALISGKEPLITSYAILSEVLTISSQKYDRKIGIAFVKDVLKSETQIFIETNELIQKTWEIFEKIKDKDVSWVDCYSFVIVEQYKIPKVFSFDKDFKKYAKATILS